MLRPLSLALALAAFPAVARAQHGTRTPLGVMVFVQVAPATMAMEWVPS